MSAPKKCVRSWIIPRLSVSTRLLGRHWLVQRSSVSRRGAVKIANHEEKDWGGSEQAQKTDPPPKRSRQEEVRGKGNTRHAGAPSVSVTPPQARSTALAPSQATASRSSPRPLLVQREKRPGSAQGHHFVRSPSDHVQRSGCHETEWRQSRRRGNPKESAVYVTPCAVKHTISWVIQMLHRQLRIVPRCLRCQLRHAARCETS